MQWHPTSRTNKWNYRFVHLLYKVILFISCFEMLYIAKDYVNHRRGIQIDCHQEHYFFCLWSQVLSKMAWPTLKKRLHKTFDFWFSIFDQGTTIHSLRLRRDFNVKTMAHFYVGDTIIWRIFTTWIMCLYQHFKNYSSYRVTPHKSACTTMWKNANLLHSILKKSLA